MNVSVKRMHNIMIATPHTQCQYTNSCTGTSIIFISMKRTHALALDSLVRRSSLLRRTDFLSLNGQRSLKRQRISDDLGLSPSLSKDDERPLLLKLLPSEVLERCFEFIFSSSSRFSVSLVCREFHRIYNSDRMLRLLDIEGDKWGDSRGFLMSKHTKEDALRRLVPLVKAGNLSAMYMLGNIRCYCYEDVDGGVKLFRRAVSFGHVRSAYSLGLILRDSVKHESNAMLSFASRKGFLPAIQEIYPTNEIKEKYGEPSASELEQFFDPPCLHKLLYRNYCTSIEHNSDNRSHCWNPKCGRWAYKIDVPPLLNKVEHCVETDFCMDTIINSINNTDGYVTQTIGVEAGSSTPKDLRISRMKMCSRCRKAKYCSKLCQVFDWRSGKHKRECTMT